MAPPLAPEEPLIEQKGNVAMRRDPCYVFYNQALQCLDEHNHQQQFCEDAFAAFKKCRWDQTRSVTTVFEQDPFIGYWIRLYRSWTGSEQPSSTSTSSSSAEYQGWRPPPGDDRRTGDATTTTSSSSSSIKPPQRWRPPSGDQRHADSSSSTGSISSSTDDSQARQPPRVEDSSPAAAASSSSSSSSSDSTSTGTSSSWGWPVRWVKKRQDAASATSI